MKHPSLKDVAYSTIRSKILNGEFQMGVRIREDLLAEEISMSRTPVREAINQLTAEGLVNNVSRGGIYLNEISPEQILELLDVRQALESLAVFRCIEKINEEQLAELETIHRQFEEALNNKQYVECNKLDSRFHRAIVSIPGNKTLIRFLSDIEVNMIIARNIEKKSDPDHKNQITFSEHAEILTHIRAGNKESAVAAIRKNINRMKLNLNINNGKEN